VQRPTSLLEWNRMFAWHLVSLVIDDKFHYAWMQTVERKLGAADIAAQLNGAIGCLRAQIARCNH
jgi:hypothetical protein